jgi:quinol monooxygenase YgiN
METKVVNVVAHMETSPDKANQLVQVCLGLVEPSRKDPGCISYELFQDKQHPGKVTFIEKWENQEALDAHLKTPHLVNGLNAIGALATKPAEVLILNKLA